jgi:hypothetical protein
MNKNLWLLIQQEDGGKWYAWMRRITSRDNIAAILENIPGEKIASVHTTKKEAGLLVNHYNACFKANGFYLFEEACQ